MVPSGGDLNDMIRRPAAEAAHPIVETAQD
jgi:hypothetical protein